MCNMFKDDNLVVESLSRNPGEHREIFVHCVRRVQWTTTETIVHLPFCIGVNAPFQITVLVRFSSVWFSSGNGFLNCLPSESCVVSFSVDD